MAKNYSTQNNRNIKFTVNSKAVSHIQFCQQPIKPNVMKNPNIIIVFINAYKLTLEFELVLHMVSVRTFSVINDYSFCLFTIKSDIRPQVKWAISLVIADGPFNLLYGFVWYVWVNILMYGETYVEI